MTRLNSKPSLAGLFLVNGFIGVLVSAQGLTRDIKRFPHPTIGRAFLFYESMNISKETPQRVQEDFIFVNSTRLQYADGLRVGMKFLNTVYQWKPPFDAEPFE